MTVSYKWDKIPFHKQKEIQDKQIKGFVQNKISRYHPYYKKLMKEKNIDPYDINSVDDFIKLFPFTYKKDVAPKPDNPFVPMEFVMLDPANRMDYHPIFMISTTGRTALNTPFWYTKWDMEHILKKNTARMAEILGITPKDVVINAFPFAPHLAFWAAYYMTTPHGITGIHTGGGKIMGTQRIVDTAFATKGTVLIAVPGYSLHVLRTAQASEKYLDRIRLVFTGGDRLPKPYRNKILKMLGEMGAPDPAISAAYGFTEARMAPVECPHQTEMTGYHTSPDMELWYVIDPDTGERVGPEEPGELVWTPFQGRGTVVMNYRTGDYVEGGIRYEKCPFCGRTVPIIDSLISRVSEQKSLNLTKIKGTLVDLNNFYSILPDIPEVEEWQIVLKKENDDPFGRDELHVHTALKKSRKYRNQRKVIKDLEERIVEVMEIRPTEIHVSTLDRLTKALGMETQLKELRIMDLRPKM
ncbi:MAG: AMP-binding protein [Candidatus Lokiarchaeota archaeon]|nr:AMP-binding protein [Candidatus Lokiarchaeota archaeon]